MLYIDENPYQNPGLRNKGYIKAVLYKSKNPYPNPGLKIRWPGEGLIAIILNT